MTTQPSWLPPSVLPRRSATPTTVKGTERMRISLPTALSPGKSTSATSAPTTATRPPTATSVSVKNRPSAMVDGVGVLVVGHASADV